MEDTFYLVPPPAKELKCLEPLIGNWTTTEKTEDSILGPGVVVVSKESYDWLEGGYFLVSTYHTVFGEEPHQTGVLYWGFDTETNKFNIHFFSNNGPYSKQGNEYIGEIADGKLTFTGPAKFQYDLDESGKIKINNDGTHSVKWWLQNEVGEWKPWMVNNFTKNKSKAK